jgi:hypothetical protein
MDEMVDQLKSLRLRRTELAVATQFKAQHKDTA